MPRTINGSLFYSLSSIKDNETYIVSSAISISGTYDNWNGWIVSGIVSEDSQLGTFIVKGTVSTIGTSFGPGEGGCPGGLGRP